MKFEEDSNLERAGLSLLNWRGFPLKMLQQKICWPISGRFRQVQAGSGRFWQVGGQEQDLAFNWEQNFFYYFALHSFCIGWDAGRRILGFLNFFEAQWGQKTVFPCIITGGWQGSSPGLLPIYDVCQEHLKYLIYATMRNVTHCIYGGVIYFKGIHREKNLMKNYFTQRIILYQLPFYIYMKILRNHWFMPFASGKPNHIPHSNLKYLIYATTWKVTHCFYGNVTYFNGIHREKNLMKNYFTQRIILYQLPFYIYMKILRNHCFLSFASGEPNHIPHSNLKYLIYAATWKVTHCFYGDVTYFNGIHREEILMKNYLTQRIILYQLPFYIYMKILRNHCFLSFASGKPSHIPHSNLKYLIYATTWKVTHCFYGNVTYFKGIHREENLMKNYFTQRIILYQLPFYIYMKILRNHCFLSFASGKPSHIPHSNLKYLIYATTWKVTHCIYGNVTYFNGIHREKNLMRNYFTQRIILYLLPFYIYMKILRNHCFLSFASGQPNHIPHSNLKYLIYATTWKVTHCIYGNVTYFNGIHREKNLMKNYFTQRIILYQLPFYIYMKILRNHCFLSFASGEPNHIPHSNLKYLIYAATWKVTHCFYGDVTYFNGIHREEILMKNYLTQRIILYQLPFYIYMKILRNHCFLSFASGKPSHIPHSNLKYQIYATMWKVTHCIYGAVIYFKGIHREKNLMKNYFTQRIILYKLPFYIYMKIWFFLECMHF